jgi:rSAM/selenodomain-associated transferase 1
MSDTAIVIMAKAPEAGRVKTRLAAAIGDAHALQVYEHLLQHTALTLGRWPGPVVVAGAGDLDLLEASPLGAYSIVPQRGDGLGARLRSAMAPLLAVHERVIAIGTDCPGLSLEALRSVDQALTDNDAAFGPASDGGYWALGLSSDLSHGICTADDLPWSQPELLTETEKRLSLNHCPFGTGSTLRDLDDAEDLAAAEAAGFTWQQPRQDSWSGFVYGTLMDADLIARVIGRSIDASPATLADFRRSSLRERAYPGILPDDGHQVDGQLVHGLSTQELVHLDRYESDCYERWTVTVSTAEGPALAHAYVLAPETRHLATGAPWDLAHWQATVGAAAAE